MALEKETFEKYSVNKARQLGTVTNILNARQLEIFTKMPLKGSFKLVMIIRYFLRNVKRFQKLICSFGG